MLKGFKYTFVAAAVAALIAGCGKDASEPAKAEPAAQKTEVKAEAKSEAQDTKTEGKKFDLGSLEKNAGYALGTAIGRQVEASIKQSAEIGVGIDADAIQQGLKDVLTGKSSISDEEIQKYLNDFQEMNRVAYEKKVKADNDANLAKGKEFLANNAKAEGVKVTPSGLQYKVIVEGDGEKVHGAQDTVKVVYTGKLIDGKVFDSNAGEGRQPIEFLLANVIPGWTEGLSLMRVGSEYTLYIPSELAYGDRKMPGNAIPPNSVLIFDVKLLDVKHPVEEKVDEAKAAVDANAEAVKAAVDAKAEEAKAVVEAKAEAAKAAVDAKAEDAKAVVEAKAEVVKAAVDAKAEEAKASAEAKADAIKAEIEAAAKEKLDAVEVTDKPIKIDSEE